MNLLTAEQITKAYTDRVLLNKVDFGISQGEKIGLVGVNGTGKSTFLKIIAGLEEPDTGQVSADNRVHIRYLHQTPVFSEDATILEAVLKDNITSQNEWSIESEAKTMINRLKLPDYNEKIAHLSGGQKKRAALAAALLAPVEILVLDEPTNHLDNEMAGWLEDYLKRLKSAVLMVTHDRYFLDRVSTRIVEIEKGNLYSYPGSYSEYLRLKAERQNMELATERKRQSLLRTELEWLHRGARARSTKQKAHIERIETMQSIEAPKEEEQVQMSSVSSRMGKKTIELTGISKAYGSKKLMEDFNYIFLKNDRIGIVGENGCGKSTLLKIITGIVEPDAGTIDTGQTIRIGYFSQENEAMDEQQKAIEYIKEVGEYVKTADGSISASQMMERFLFDGTLQWTQIAKLSGGEKRRLYLLRVLMSEPNVLILDEPTNDLDIQTLTILEDYLDQFDGIVITVSHDRYFLDRIVSRIFAFEGDGTVRQYEGGYTDYLAASQLRREMQKSQENGVGSAAVPADKEKKATEKPRERKLKFSYNEQREFETIDGDIAGLEERIDRLEHEIEANATNSVRLGELMKEKEETEQKLEEKMERWVYLNELKEQMEARA